MKPIISFSWLSLFFALTPNLQARPTADPTTQPSTSSETQGKLTTISPSKYSSSFSLTEKQPKNESHGKNATNKMAGLTTTSTTTELMSSTAQLTEMATKTSTKNATTQNTVQSTIGSSTKTTSPNKTTATKKVDNRGGAGTVVKLLSILAVLLLVFVVIFRWLYRQTGPAGDATRRCSHGLQEQLRSVVAAIERCLGLSLWPRKRMDNEEDAEEEEEMNGSNGTAGSSKVQRGCQKGGEEEDNDEEDDEDQREEDGDSSDDYSSLEGMDLRERARQKQDEEMSGEQERASKTEGAEGDLTSITLGEENKEGPEEDDVTEL